MHIIQQVYLLENDGNHGIDVYSSLSSKNNMRVLLSYFKICFPPFVQFTVYKGFVKGFLINKGT